MIQHFSAKSGCLPNGISDRTPPFFITIRHFSIKYYTLLSLKPLFYSIKEAKSPKQSFFRNVKFFLDKVTSLFYNSTQQLDTCARCTFDHPSARRIEATRTAGSNAENPSKSRGPYRGYGLATFVALLMERLSLRFYKLVYFITCAWRTSTCEMVNKSDLKVLHPQERSLSTGTPSVSLWRKFRRHGVPVWVAHRVFLSSAPGGDIKIC